MPAKAKTEDPTGDVVAAVSEVIDPKVEVVFEFNDHAYQFKRKRLDATQFRLPMQKGFNEVAVEWLLGPSQFNVFLTRNSDEDGITSAEVFFEFVNKLGESLGTGNS